MSAHVTVCDGDPLLGFYMKSRVKTHSMYMPLP